MARNDGKFIVNVKITSYRKRTSVFMECDLYTYGPTTNYIQSLSRTQEVVLIVVFVLLTQNFFWKNELNLGVLQKVSGAFDTVQGVDRNEFRKENFVQREGDNLAVSILTSLVQTEQVGYINTNRAVDQIFFTRFYHLLETVSKELCNRVN